MAKAGPRKIARYGECFKATAVMLSSLPSVKIKDVAAAPDIHPFMLPLWRKRVRERVFVARASKLDVETTAELRRLREPERRYKVLKEEHELVKKAIGSKRTLDVPFKQMQIHAEMSTEPMPSLRAHRLLGLRSHHDGEVTW